MHGVCFVDPYSRLINLLMRINALPRQEVVRKVLEVAQGPMLGSLLYIVYSLNSSERIDAWFRGFKISVDSGYSTSGSAGEFSRTLLRSLIVGNYRYIVMLFRQEIHGNNVAYRKIPTRPFYNITMNPAISFVASSILTILIFLTLTRFSLWLTFAAAALQVSIVNVAYSVISLRRMTKVRINGSKILKIIARLPREDEETASRIIAYASTISLISQGEIADIISKLRGIAKVSDVYLELINIPDFKGVDIYIVPSPDCNATSVKLVKGIILVATRLVACLNQDELDAVLNHELAHLKRLDTLRSLLYSLAYSLASLVVLVMFIARMGNIEAWLIYAAMVVAALLISLALSRYSEVKADQYAAMRTSVKALALALTKATYPNIYENPLVEAFRGHPSTLRRINNISRLNLLKTPQEP